MTSANKLTLVADDEFSDRYLMTEAWKEAGITHRIVTVEDGEEAIEYLEGRGKYADRASNPLPCLVILDLSMPRKSGFDVLEWMKKPENARYHSLPVIILSASSHPRDVALAYRLGASAYVAKPSTADELVELVTAIDDFWLRFTEFPPENPT